MVWYMILFARQVSEYSTTTTWRLTPSEMRKVLQLRSVVLDNFKSKIILSVVYKARMGIEIDFTLF